MEEYGDLARCAHFVIELKYLTSVRGVNVHSVNESYQVRIARNLSMLAFGKEFDKKKRAERQDRGHKVEIYENANMITVHLATFVLLTQNLPHKSSYSNEDSSYSPPSKHRSVPCRPNPKPDQNQPVKPRSHRYQRSLSPRIYVNRGESHDFKD